MANIWIIEDDKMLSECLSRAVNYLPDSSKKVYPQHNIKTFSNIITAINSLDDGLPDLVILDVLLSGPDGFSFLNELISYHDTTNIPVIIVTTLAPPDDSLAHYNVTKILQQETMTPSEIKSAVEEALQYGD